ncbi:MAG TPA: FAD:protein FMN transferase [Patescibacteria group bacterium]|nr:FAD:protein FMN transferase [Patescibacteria group bacterium]
MRQTQLIMGMPITVDLVHEKQSIFDEIFSFFRAVDRKFSPYKKGSEVSRINRNELLPNAYSKDMKTILSLAEQTKQQTNGYFDIWKNGVLDPSGLVKGWAVYRAAHILSKKRYEHFYINAGGDVQVSGCNEKGKQWTVGIQNPFLPGKIVKVLILLNKGVATSGTYIRGQHIYNPHNIDKHITDIVSITVVGPNIYEADRFATAAFAMGKNGIHFLERQKGLEGYMIDKKGIATYTSGFDSYVFTERN